MMAIFKRSSTPDIEKLKSKRDIKGLIVALSYQDAAIRRDAAIALGELDDPQARQPLLGSLGDVDQRVRLRAAAALIRLGDGQGVGFISASLKDEETKYETSQLLADFRPTDPFVAALPAPARLELLILQLECPHFGRRQEAREALKSLLPSDEYSRLVRKSEIHVLIAQLQEWNASDAEKTLLALRDPTAADALIKFLTDTTVRKGREAAARILGKMGDSRAVGPLIAVIESAQSVFLLREAAINALSKLHDSRSLEPLVLVLKNDESNRAVAASALGALGNPEALEPLVSALQDKSDSVRQGVAWALAQLGGKRGAEALIVACTKENNPDVRKTMANALRRFPLKDLETAASSLYPSLKADDAGIRWEATKLLRQIGTPVTPQLLNLLQDRDARVRESAASALNSARAINPLLAVLKDEFREVRKAAIGSLGRIAGVRVLEAIAGALGDESPEVREAAVSALGSIGAPAKEHLRMALNDESPEVRKAAEGYLETIDRRREVIDELVQSDFAKARSCLRNDSWMIRGQAASQLRDLRAPEALGLLGSILKSDPNPTVRQTAVQGVGEIAINSAIQEAEDLLILALDDPEEGWVVEEAVKYLERLGGDKTERAIALYRTKSAPKE